MRRRSLVRGLTKQRARYALDHQQTPLSVAKHTANG
jgi:hypothetical protein